MKNPGKTTNNQKKHEKEAATTNTTTTPQNKYIPTGVLERLACAEVLKRASLGLHMHSLCGYKHMQFTWVHKMSMNYRGSYKLATDPPIVQQHQWL